MNRLDGRVALVTGAASGIGRAILERLAAEGAAVVATDVNDEPGTSAVKAVTEAGGRASYVHLDVTSEQDWSAAVRHAVDEYGGLDILVNNAGMGDLATVNSVHPGFIDTPMLEQAKGTPFERTMIDLTPMGRLGRPDEIAAGVAYLAGDDASFVTGLELYIDGGYLAR
ncbi:SDR family NAD(P)-dependent oxidoreductase [Jiangella rhizosphaerae]|uniref:SDR family oxidoreductase n=1 Tax=Jiangella rhizosphaerae TaxID=2293569 RepID=A0A418KL30_9ACTN|nr:SDR family oxidoreductase [Jiangella rhizosphaerae]RIQ18222.1 SDR family oxidoreductase [Jiangella rhizosphaerae]